MHVQHSPPPSIPATTHSRIQLYPSLVCLAHARTDIRTHAHMHGAPHTRTHHTHTHTTRAHTPRAHTTHAYHARTRTRTRTHTTNAQAKTTRTRPTHTTHARIPHTHTPRAHHSRTRTPRTHAHHTNARTQEREGGFMTLQSHFQSHLLLNVQIKWKIE